jgi:hypothetical protein
VLDRVYTAGASQRVVQIRYNIKMYSVHLTDKFLRRNIMIFSFVCWDEKEADLESKETKSFEW